MTLITVSVALGHAMISTPSTTVTIGLHQEACSGPSPWAPGTRR